MEHYITRLHRNRWSALSVRTKMNGIHVVVRFKMSSFLVATKMVETIVTESLRTELSKRKAQTLPLCDHSIHCW